MRTDRIPEKKHKTPFSFTAFPLAAALALACGTPAAGEPMASRPWIGPDFWTNPMEDWQWDGNAARNTHSGGDRNIALLTAELSDRDQPFAIRCTFEPLDETEGDGFVGFQLGLQGNFDDYRDSAIYGRGMAAGVSGNGRLFIGGLFSDEPVFNPAAGAFHLSLTGEPAGEGRFHLTLTATPVGDGAGAAAFTNEGVHSSWLEGLISFTVSARPPEQTIVRQPRPEQVPAISQQRGGNWFFALSNMEADGDKFDRILGRSFGPILWTQHTLQEGTLVMTVQFTPLDSPEPARLEIGETTTAESMVHPHARVARFVVHGLEPESPHLYTVRWAGAEFSATLHAEPVKKDELVVVAMSCNDATGFPHCLLVDNVTAQQPDLIAFLGDQIYEPIGGYGFFQGECNTVYDDRVALSYLRKFYMHGWTWGPLLSRIPSVSIPDDHDVFHGNYWGEGGKLADRTLANNTDVQDAGGYKMPADAVNVVHLTQTGNLPTWEDAAPASNHISVYFTRWHYAGLDMAIISDRQFKSAPRALFPEAEIINGWPQNHDFQHPNIADPKVFDIPEASLLGDRQQRFLHHWADEPAPDTRWRILFSQSPFACVHTLPADAFSDAVVPRLPGLQPGDFPEDDMVKIDFDTNGWPQSKRDKVVGAMARAGALHVAGDQHLGMTGQYGVSEHNDAGWWLATPAIANIWPRRWFPGKPGEHRRDGDPPNTGQFLDGFANKVTIHAVANPQITGREPARLYDRAVGYSLLRLHRETGHITMENWPYYAGPDRTAPENQPFSGWPITIDPSSSQRVK